MSAALLILGAVVLAALALWLGRRDAAAQAGFLNAGSTLLSGVGRALSIKPPV